jgi:hypothetical protein
MVFKQQQQQKEYRVAMWYSKKIIRSESSSSECSLPMVTLSNFVTLGKSLIFISI